MASTEHASAVVWTVEVRLTDGATPPTEENGMLVDHEWRHVYFHRGLFGVPSGLHYNALAEARGFLSKDSATALAWWFLASSKSLGIEARLVPHQFVYDMTVTRQEPLAAISRTLWADQKELAAELKRAADAVVDATKEGQ